MQKKIDPIKFCAKCQKPMFRKRVGSRLEDRTVFLNRKFCDRRCMALNMEGKIKVLTPQSSRNQATKKMKAACEDCGGCHRMAVHHVDGNPLNNDPQNLRTLCASCHMRTHWREWRATTRQQKQCKVCDKPARHVGYCNTHYTRFRKHGDPLIVVRWNGHGERVVLRVGS